MKVEWAVLGGALLIAVAILLTNHWQMQVVPQGGIIRLDRWTGAISGCTSNKGAAGEELPDGKFVPICQ